MALISQSLVIIKSNPQIQILAVIIVVFMGFFLHFVSIIACFLLFFSPCWPIPVIYGTLVITYDWSRSSCGGRRFNWLRNLPLWKHFAYYFPINLIKTAHLDAKKNYIFAFHPHGIMVASAFANFGTEGTGFSEKFPGITPYLLVLKCKFGHLYLFYDPFCIYLIYQGKI